MLPLLRVRTAVAALAIAAACSSSSQAAPIAGVFEGFVYNSYDNLGSVFGVHGPDHQVNWRVTGSFSFDDSAAGVVDGAPAPDAGYWQDPAHMLEWVTMSLTFYDLDGDNRGTFAPQSFSSYSPPASLGLDAVSVDDFQEGPFNNFTDSPIEQFAIRDGFNAPNTFSSPPPSIYRDEEISISLIGSHFTHDFITGDGLAQLFTYDRATWTFGDAKGSYTFIDKVANTGSVTDFTHWISGDFSINSMTLFRPEGTTPVPEPSTVLLLLTSGLVGTTLSLKRLAAARAQSKD